MWVWLKTHKTHLINIMRGESLVACYPHKSLGSVSLHLPSYPNEFSWYRIFADGNFILRLVVKCVSRLHLISNTMTSQWPRRRFKSPASRLFTQSFIRAQIKENIKAPRHWPLCGEFTGTGEFPAQRASNAEKVSIWWRHHATQILKQNCHPG